MTREGLYSDFLRGLYSGRITKIYERWITEQRRRYVRKSGEVVEKPYYTLTLPSSWVETWEEAPRSLIILETRTGDLIILHPETVEEVGGAIEGIIKANKIRIEMNYRLREGLLWRILRKYRGPWKSADKRRGIKKVDYKDETDRELARGWGGRKNVIGW